MSQLSSKKNIAVNEETHQLLKALCMQNFRKPGAFVEKLIIDHMRFRAEKENVSFEKYKNNLLKGIS
jgi:hypothetical protein|tara:strand:+ start:1479 stop:1679 length:201 start_codon:yes stop_codon:yes gene_type:complete